MSNTTTSHKQYVDYIISSVEARCPHKTEDEIRSYVIGFLASYIASKITQDPYVYKEFKRVVNR